MKKNKVIYHSADLDGFCSGALAKKFLMENYSGEVEMIPYNYGQPTDKIIESIKKDDIVIMTDVSFPVNDMANLYSILEKNFIWIDHHKTAMEESDHDFVSGLRRVGDSASLLALEYFGNKGINKWGFPTIVYYVDRYDVWKQDFRDGVCWESVMNAQYGMRFNLSDPVDPDAFESWNLMFDDDRLFKTVLQDGKTIYDYEKQTNVIRCKKAAFRVEFEGIKFAAINNVLAGSMVLDSFATHEDDALMVFCYAKGAWTVSLYQNTLNPTKIDLSVIAKKYGGGGHAGACGFMVKDIKQVIGY